MTYREGVRRKPIAAPWGKPRDLLRPGVCSAVVGAAASTGATGAWFGAESAAGVGVAAVFVLAVAALFLVGGGGAKLSASKQVTEAPLVEAGMRQVSFSEWRGDLEDHPCRMKFSTVSRKSRVELAMGSVPRLRLRASNPARDRSADPATKIVEGMLVQSDRIDLAREVVEAAVAATRAKRPTMHRLRLVERVIRVEVVRPVKDAAGAPLAARLQYEPVVWALRFSLEVARALEARGEGLAVFEE